MMRTQYGWIAALVLAACATLAPTEVAAQAPSVGGQIRGASRPEYARARNRPTVSPYLNLFRGDGGAGLNYYNLVRPQVQQYQAEQIQAYEIGRLQQQVGVIERRRAAAPPRATGHATQFFDTSHYFPGSPRGVNASPR